MEKQEDIMEKFKLSPEENEKVFQDMILPYFTRGKNPSNSPSFVLLTGQPGAGKTTLSNKYASENEGDTVVFGADDLRALHPHKEEIMKNHEKDYPFITKHDSGIWRAKLFDYCLKNKINVVVESIMTGENDHKLPVFEDAKNAGFKTECAFLGVDKNLSTLGIFRRYEMQKEATGRGFPPTLDNHNKAYEMMKPLAIKMLYNPSVDNIKVFDRDLECYFDKSKLTSGIAEKEIVSGITQARRSSLRKTNMITFESDWDYVLSQMNKRGDSTREISSVVNLRRSAIKDLGIDLISNMRQVASRAR